ncbi:MAG: alpha/beta fold hydrolase [Verrucomicrobia bacterium]|jgi:alpha-beta hydrolase superfamily lysophospholipase|nr:alpha/beta fold hydrolase [Verrucomicrobiota bacterium]
MKNRKLKTIGITLLGVAMLIPILAWILIQLPMPEIPDDVMITQEQATNEGLTVDQIYSFESVEFKVSDGLMLKGSRFASPSPHSLLFLHGASAFSSELNKSIGLIRERTGIEAFSYDHRGHGDSPGVRGHVDFVGQYVSDLSDVIETILKLKPNGQLILAGHSMGGGILQQYAMRDEPSKVDAYLLFAPVVGMDFPESTPPDHISIHMGRALGILVMQKLGIHTFDTMPVVRLGVPMFPGHINEYSLNAARSMRPQNYKEAFASLTEPTLFILGENDTVGGVKTQNIAQEIQSHSNAKVQIIPNEHHHVQNNPNAITTVAQWLEEILP